MKVLMLSKKPRNYIPLDYREEPNPPIFVVRSLSRREYLKVMADLNMTMKLNDLMSLSKILKEQQKTEGPDEKEQQKTEGPEVNVWQQLYSSLDFNIKALQAGGLVGWQNVSDENGEAIPFSKEAIEYLDGKVIEELFQEVSGVMRQDDRKNSETPSLGANGFETTQDGVATNAEEITSKTSETVTE